MKFCASAKQFSRNLARAGDRGRYQFKRLADAPNSTDGGADASRL